MSDLPSVIFNSEKGERELLLFQTNKKVTKYTQNRVGRDTGNITNFVKTSIYKEGKNIIYDADLNFKKRGYQTKSFEVASKI